MRKIFLIICLPVFLTLFFAPQKIAAASDSLDCAPLTSTPSTGGGSGGLLNLFAGLLSFFTPPPPSDLTATCADAKTDLTANPDIYGRTAGRPFCDKPKNVTVTLTTAGGAKQQNYLFGFIGDLFQTFERKTTLGGYVPDYGVSSQTPGKEQFKPDTQTVRGYLGGRFSPDEVSKWITYKTSTDPNKTPGDELYEKAGVLAKLSPPDCKSVTGTWKPCQDAWRDRVLAAIVRGYSCSLFKTHCDGEKTHDYPAGWLHIPDGVSGDVTTTATWITPTAFAEVTRPLMGIEFACTGNFATPDISRSQVENVCSQVMGSGYRDGLIAASSLFGQTFTYRLRTCAADCLYGAGSAWYLLPNTINDDLAAEVYENTDAKDQDLLGQQLSRNKTIGLPGILSARQLTNYVDGFFTSPDTQSKRKPFDLPQNQCLKNAVSGRINDPIAGAKIDDDRTNSYTAGKTIGSTLGMTSGEVLQAVSQPSPTPKTETYTFNRGQTITVKLTDDIPTLISQSSGPGGWLREFLPYEVAQKLDVKAGGTPIGALGTALNVACEGDFACDPNSGTPGIGGPLITGLRPGTSLLSELIRPYDANSKQTSVSHQIHELATVNQLQTSPWQELASFQNRELKKDLSRIQ